MKKYYCLMLFALLLASVLSASADYSTYYDVSGDVQKLLSDPVDATWEKSFDEVLSMTEGLEGYSCETDDGIIYCYKEHWTGYFHIDFLFETETLDAIDVYLTAGNIAGLFYDENSENVPVANEMMSRFFQNSRFAGKGNLSVDQSKPYIFPAWGSVAIAPAIRLDQNSFIQFGFIPKNVISRNFYLEYAITSGEFAEGISKEDSGETETAADPNEVYYESCVREEKYFTDVFHESCKVTNSKGRPAVDPAKGYAQRYVTYRKTNPAKNSYYPVMVEYKDVAGQPILIKEGYASYTMDMTADESILLRSYFGLDGKLIMREGGYASYIREESADGLTVKMTYYDINNEKVMQDGGYASFVREDSADGLTEKITFFDINNEKVLLDEGYASYVIEDSEDGLVSKYTYFGLDGEPVIRDEGYASYVIERSDDGLTKSAHYYGLDGSPVMLNDGYSYYVETWTADKSESFRRYYDLNDQPVVNQSTGAAALHYYYDEDGNNKRLDYLGLDDGLTIRNGQAYSTILYRFDEETHQNYTVGYLDKEGNLVAVND